MEDIKNTLSEVLEFQLLDLKNFNIQVYHLVILVLFLISYKGFLIYYKKFLRSYFDKGQNDEGRSQAVYQLSKYFLTVIIVVTYLEVIGVNLSIFLAGSAALFVGIGFGIKEIFFDFVAGVILLFEGTIRVGDIIEIDGLVGKVRKVDFRTSKIETRDNQVIIVPNAKLVEDNVINWSHNRSQTRFVINVGVAYGSDLRLVQSLLIEAAKQSPSVSKLHEPMARIIDFGDSSVDFELLFWCTDMFRIEFIKSDIRFDIDRLFRENKVTIPFPQRDLHVKEVVK